MRRAAALCLAVTLFAACSAELKEGHYVCTSAAQCPAGWFCVSGRCFSSPAGGMDAGMRDAGGDPDAGPPFDAGPDHDAGPPPPDAGSDAGGCAPCGPYETCVDRTCQCLAPFAVCSGACVDPRNDSMHCGATCQDCTTTTRPSCVASDCVMCTEDIACEDGFACTTDRCAAGSVCEHTVEPDRCLIGGACIASGTANADNPCQVCDPVRAPRGWSIALGASCNDGNATTCGETCNDSGACAGGTTPTCEDGNPCTTDSIACAAPERCAHVPVADATDTCCARQSVGGCVRCWIFCRGGACTEEPPLCETFAGCGGPACGPAPGCRVGTGARTSDCDRDCCNGVCCT